MELALHEALKSPDPSTQNGACIVHWNKFQNQYDQFFYAKGYNHFVEKTPRELEDRDRRLQLITHAEEDAVFDMLRKSQYGTASNHHTMVAVWAACSNCARMIVRSGVKKLVRMPLPQTERWAKSISIGDEIMMSNGVEIIDYPSEQKFGVELRFSGEKILL